MRVLVCLAVLAVVVTGHWTHDDALAREIGAPAGEADVDVSMLADEVVSTGRKLLQAATVMGSDNTIKQKMDSDPNFRNQPVMSAKDGAYATIGTEEHFAKGNADGHTANKQYRITIGTKFDAPGGYCAATEFPGPTNCQVQFVLEGEYTTAAGIGSNFDNTKFKALRSYIGPTAMAYADAKTLSAPLHPGMQAMIVGASDSSSLSIGGSLMCADRLGNAKLAGYNSDPSASEWEEDSQTPCEPNTKECKQAIAAMGAPVGAGGQESSWDTDAGAGGIAYRVIPLKTLTEVEEATAGGGTTTKPVMMGTAREWDGQALPTPPAPDVHPQFTDKPTIIVQRGQIEHPDVGVIRKVKARLAPDDASITKCGKWKAEFIKIDTNDVFTGVGNGIYYIPGTDTGDATVNEGGIWDSSGTALNGPGPTTTWAVEDAEITRCMADTCEEEMDSKFGMA